MWCSYRGTNEKLLVNSLLTLYLAASLKPNKGPYGPHAATAMAQGVYLLLIGGINGESGPEFRP